VSNFKHVIFAINGKYFEKIMTIQISMLHLGFFKHTKMQFLKVSTHFGGSFDYIFTHLHLGRGLIIEFHVELKFVDHLVELHHIFDII